MDELLKCGQCGAIGKPELIATGACHANEDVPMRTLAGRGALMHTLDDGAAWSLFAAAVLHNDCTESHAIRIADKMHEAWRERFGDK